MDVVFSADDRSDVLVIPIPPSEMEIGFPHNNINIDTADGSTLKILGNPSLKSVAFSSWVPVTRAYSFMQSNVYAPRLKEFFVKYKREKKPVRLVLTYSNGYELHNELYAIEEFNFGYNRTGDMTYTLKLESLGDNRV